MRQLSALVRLISLLSLGLLANARVLSTFQRDNSSETAKCRCAPSEACFPTTETWAQLNTSVSGRLVNVVSSAAFCDDLSVSGCTEAQWESSVFRAGVPGAMNQVSFLLNRRVVILFELTIPLGKLGTSRYG